MKPLGALFATAALLAAGSAAAAASAAPATGRAALAGVWMVRGYQPTMKTVEGELPPFQPWAAEAYKKSLDAQEAGKPLLDSSTRCLPHGIPRLMYAPYPIQILLEPKQVTILHEVNHMVRWVYMDEPQPQDLDDTYLGHSVGRWEGDTLVIDTIGLNDKTLLDRAGIPHTTALRVTERLRVIDGGKAMEDVITIDDPKTFTRPWNARIVFDRRPDIRLMEYVCTENNRND
jgi:hypothetical protein